MLNWDRHTGKALWVLDSCLWRPRAVIIRQGKFPALKEFLFTKQFKELCENFHLGFLLSSLIFFCLFINCCESGYNLIAYTWHVTDNFSTMSGILLMMSRLLSNYHEISVS